MQEERGALFPGRVEDVRRRLEFAPIKFQRAGKGPIERMLNQSGANRILQNVRGDGIKILTGANHMVVKALLPEVRRAQFASLGSGGPFESAHGVRQVARIVARGQNEMAMIWHKTISVDSEMKL